MRTTKLLFFKFAAVLKLLYFILFEMKKIKKAKTVFFFPFYHTGGAEKVHLNIVKATNNNNNCVFFTQESNSNNYKKQFFLNSKCFEVYDLLHRNYLIRNLFIKKLANELNKSKELISVFGSNAFFFYELLPLLNDSVKKIDLIHAFSKPDYGIEIASLPYVKYLDRRVVINEKTLLDFKGLYHQKKLDSFFSKILKIENGIDIKDIVLNKSNKSKFRVLFVGRWSKEKRPNLFLQIAKRIASTHSDIEFIMVGSQMELHKKNILNAGVLFKGEIKNENELNNIYKTANLLLITSYREGFPVVVMEAMANGVVPIVTNVGGLKEHITNEVNGILIEDKKNEIALIEKFSDIISKLYNDTMELEKLSENAFTYAHSHFDIETFKTKYKNLLLKN
ncbi:glycosyltransferase family 4 protein [Flavobacterium sp. N2820]|uniref:glycosyltransferase family 4 protein n=1 Tax=Flavobacterium sp. N2820 TaxID=2986834 RepID=UPI002224A004|nr:glycosyltransferase family 4 protein [Flavobacterium sp. N2820]